MEEDGEPELLWSQRHGGSPAWRSKVSLNPVWMWEQRRILAIRTRGNRRRHARANVPAFGFMLAASSLADPPRRARAGGGRQSATFVMLMPAPVTLCK